MIALQWKSCMTMKNEGNCLGRAGADAMHGSSGKGLWAEVS